MSVDRQSMSICSFLVPTLRDIPDLEKVVPSSVAEAVRKEVGSALVQKPGLNERKRGTYGKITPEKRAKIAKYAAENGIAAAIRHFKTKEGFSPSTLKESTVRGWKKLYCEELDRRKKKADDEPVQELPLKQTGRPLLLGRDVEESARNIIHQIRQAGGIVNNSVVIGVITGILRGTDSSLLSENGGPINVNKEVARRLLSRMQFVKRKGTTKAKVSPSDFQVLKSQFLDDIRTDIMFEGIPARLVLNWDDTGLNYVPSSSWTMEAKGSQQVPITAIDDKRQLTAVFACSLAGDFLPPQLIYSGKTPACLPKATFPPDWHITYTHNHWTNEESMMDYVQCILFPYLKATKKQFKLPSNYPALAIFDQFRGQLTDSFLKCLATNNVIIVEVPPNCTGNLQPLDLSVNKAIKDSLKWKFQLWYADNIQKQLKTTSEEDIKPVDLRLAIMKPLSAKWFIDVVEEIGQRKELITNGFHNAGITDAVKDLV